VVVFHPTHCSVRIQVAQVDHAAPATAAPGIGICHWNLHAKRMTAPRGAVVCPQGGAAPPGSQKKAGPGGPHQVAQAATVLRISSAGGKPYSLSAFLWVNFSISSCFQPAT